MGCGKPSKIVPTSPTTATDKQQSVAAPRRAATIPHSNGTGASQRSSIPILATKARSGAPSNGNSLGSHGSHGSHGSANDSLKENSAPPNSPPKSTKSPPPAGPKRVNSRPTSRLSSGSARGAGTTSPNGSAVSGRNLKVQKRPRSRGSGDLLNSCGSNMGKSVDKSKALLQEREMNGENGTGVISKNSNLSTGGSNPLRSASTTVSNIPKTTNGGLRGEASNPSITSKPGSLELVVVVDPEVEGKTRIPRPRQAHKLVDPRRYIRVAHSYEDLLDSANGPRRVVSATQPSLRKVSKTVPVQQQNEQTRTRKPQLQQRPKSMLLFGSPESKAVGVGSWATPRGAVGKVAT